jgi:CPA2 family monovalent cation:H+ antiporter-2
VTYISSSGVIAKVLSELGRLNKPETSVILSILVLEDLAMALYLPLVAVLLIGQDWMSGFISILIALVTVSLVLFIAVQYGERISENISHESNEIILLTTFGTILLVAGIAQRLQVSAAIGAFLVGISLSGPIAERAHNLISPLRDLFAATFFFFFGLQIDPATLPPVVLLAVALGIVTALTKLLTGLWAARRAGIDRAGQFRAGGALVARGEFSIVIAGLGVNAGLEAGIGSLATAYVLCMVLLGPILSRLIPD